MSFVRVILVTAFAAGLAACGTYVSKEIEGNNTGGVIPPALARGANVQALADGHCAKWKSKGRITFGQAETGGEVVFVCDSNAPWLPKLVPAEPEQTPANPSQPRRTS